MGNAGLDEAQAGIKTGGRNLNNLRYSGDTTPTAESEEELKSLLMRVKEERERASLRLKYQKNTKTVASAPSLHGKQEGKGGSRQISSPWASESLWTVTAARKSEDGCVLVGKR